ncbi:MAG: beta-fructofuranosidase [Solirubrobacteraceae bacterium]|jgi:beta-fructofuranosidase|nr:beta-fructofuranosidase [Solirubrobacteraceae bacterium]
MSERTSLYRPRDGWFGDVAPIHVDGTFHLFYTFLHREDRGGPGLLKRLAWAHVATRDFLTFEELPLAIPAGGPDDADLLAGAGSVVDAGDCEYVAFYCGINPRKVAEGAAEQVVLRATSRDLVTWEKDEDFAFEADERWYERHDWRDPFVFRDGHGWRMLLCARVPDGPFDRRGAIGMATSPDLVHWTAEPPLLAPGITRAPECPEVFDLGPDAYLLYSTYSDRFASRYRVGGATLGSWQRPADDALESNDVYAISTVGDGERRFAIGWLASRAGNRDGGHRQWGGDLVAHELVRRPDGGLGARAVPGALERFDAQPATAEPRGGAWALGDDSASFGGSGFGWCSLGEVGERALLEVTVHLDDPAEEVGVAIRAAPDFASSYLLRLEPAHGRVVFDRRPHRIDVPFDQHSDRGYVSAPDHEIERPLRIEDGAARIRVVVDGSAITAYVGDVALTTRGYDLDGGEFGVYAANGRARFSGVAVGRLDDAATGPALTAAGRAD